MPAAESVAVRSEPAAPTPVAPEPPHRRTLWDILQDLTAALPRDRVFDHSRLHEALGYEPERSSRTGFSSNSWRMVIFR